MQTNKTLRNSLWPHLLKICFPTNSIMYVSDRGASQRHISPNALVDSCNAGSRHPLECVRIILPSEWVRIDVATYAFYKDVFDNPNAQTRSFLSIERASIVQRRAEMLGITRQLWCQFENAVWPTRLGDLVQIPCTSIPSFISERHALEEIWGVRRTTSVRTTQRNPQQHTIRGYFGPSCLVN